jgi:hypothetical protein
MKMFGISSCILALVSVALGQGYKPPSGYVPNSDIAVAALVPVYGKKQIESEKPFTAKLKDNIWTVAGTLRCPDGKGGMTTSCVGGTAVVEISKEDGRIISMGHFK